MPIGALAGLGINILSNAATNAINYGFNQANNRNQQRYNDQVYNRQRQDALADWTMQNEYNSPRAQMQRYQEAGLNPNLIYGQSNTAQPIRSTDAKSYTPQPFRADTSGISNALAQYQDTRMKSAQMDLLSKQQSIADADIILKKAQTNQTLASTEQTLANTNTTKFDLGVKEAIRNSSLQMADLNVQKLAADVAYTKNSMQLATNADIRAAASNSSSLAEATERILRSVAERSKIPLEKKEIEARIKLIGQDTKLKDLDNQLREKGIQPHDALWQRTLKGVLENNPRFNELLKYTTDKWKDDIDFIKTNKQLFKKFW